MKRSISKSSDPINTTIDLNNINTKKIKLSKNQTPVTNTDITDNTTPYVLSDENLLYEILKHVDARTLGAACCVSKQWNRISQDERLWELICTRHSANIGCGNNQFRSVVIALGGFRRLHAHYLWPLSKPSGSTIPSSSSSSTVAAATSSSSVWPCLPPPRSIGVAKSASPRIHWGKDEVQLSLSLLSIRYYEKMNFNNRTR